MPQTDIATIFLTVTYEFLIICLMVFLFQTNSFFTLCNILKYKLKYKVKTILYFKN